MKKKKVLSFNKTLKSRQVWITSFAYHIIISVAYLIIPKWFVTNTNKVIFPEETSINIPKIVNLSQIGAGKPFYQNPSIILDIFIFDMLFVLLFLFVKRSKPIRYNIYAICLATVITNLLYFLLIPSILDLHV
jgi:hypothetical protein